MTKANVFLGLIVLIMGVVAGVMVLAPDLADKFLNAPSVSPPSSVAIVKKTDGQKPEQIESPEREAEQATASREEGKTTDKTPGEEKLSEAKNDYSVSGAALSIKTEDFDDWRVECVQDSEPQGKAPPSCSMFQRLMWEEGAASPALKVTVIMAEREGKAIPRMRMTAPLGTFLPAGLTLMIEGEEEASILFQFCSNEGCFVNLDMADDVVSKLKEKSVLKTMYIRADGKKAELDVSLKGFSKALERISIQ